MTNIVNPITCKGKVKCIHYYESCLTRWYDVFMCIFIHENHVYFYSVGDESKKFDHKNKTLIDFGENDPLIMDLALIHFTKQIYHE